MPHKPKGIEEHLDEIVGPDPKPAEAPAAVETSSQPEAEAGAAPLGTTEPTLPAPAATPPPEPEQVDWTQLEPLRGQDLSPAALLKKIRERDDEHTQRERNQSGVIGRLRSDLDRIQREPRPSPASPSQPATVGRLKVEVDEKTGDIYMPEDEVQRRIDERVTAATAPKPTAVAMAQFTRDAGEDAAAAIQRAQDATLAFVNLATEMDALTGLGDKPDPDTVIEALIGSGVAARLAEKFPELAGSGLDVMVDAIYQQTPRRVQRLFETFRKPKTGAPPLSQVRIPNPPPSPASRGAGAVAAAKSPEQIRDELNAKDADQWTDEDLKTAQRVARQLAGRA